MATMLKHLKPYEMPPCTNVPSGMPGAPSVQSIVIDRVSVVEPEVAAIIRDNLEVVVACFENSHAACPTHSEVIASVEPWPPSTRVAIVHGMSPSCHVWLATIQVLAIASLTEVESVLPEESSAVCDLMCGVASATRAHDHPTVASIVTPVPEQHPCVAAVLKHLQPDKMPSTTQVLVGFTITPAMQTIVVDRVPIVDPQVAAIIRDNTESVMARPEDPQAASPTHSEVVASAKA
jgi:hypothetical protein